MRKLKIVTDSNSGILQSEADDLGIYVIPMPFTVNGEEFLEEITMSQEKFFECLANDADVKTSQPSQIYLEDLWDTLLKDNDEILYIPMTSGLSATCSNAKRYAENEKYINKVFVVDNKRISVTQKASVFEAIELAKSGKDAKFIRDYLEETGPKHSIFITVSTLKYLKKGGRINPAVAVVGSLLNIKPVLYSRGENFNKLAMTMSMSQAKKKMLAQIKQELETDFKDDYKKGLMQISVAHTQNEKEAEKFKAEILEMFPNVKFAFVDPLSLSVACHIGPGSLAITICRVQYESK